MREWYHRQLAHRAGFTDEEYDRGEIYEATLADSLQPIDALRDAYGEAVEEYAAQRGRNHDPRKAG